MIFEQVEQRITRMGRAPETAVNQRGLIPVDSDYTAMLWSAIAGKKPKKAAGDYATANTVYACMTGRAQLLQMLPLKAYRFKKSRSRWAGQGQGRQTAVARVQKRLKAADQRAWQRIIQEEEMEEVVQGPLVDLLHYVNPHWSDNRLWEMTSMSLDLYGRCFWFFDRLGRKLPQEIWWARGDRVEVVVDPKKYIAGYIYTPPNGGGPIAFAPEEVVWFNFSDPRDEFGSLSPLDAARVYADYEASSMRANQALHDQGMNMGGVIYPLNGKTWQENDAAAIERHINNRFAGADKAHRWSVFRQEVGIDKGNISPRDADFVEGMGLSLRAVARAYHWPVYLLGEVDATYQNLKEAKKGAWTLSVIPLATFLAAELTEKMLPLFPGEADLLYFDPTDVPELQEDEAERWERASAQIERGALLINEWRNSEGLEPLPWGDVWWPAGAMAPVTGETAVSPPAAIQEPARARLLADGQRQAEGDIPPELRDYEAALLALIASGTAGKLSRDELESELNRAVIAFMVLAFLRGARLDGEEELDSEERDQIRDYSLLAAAAVPSLAGDVADGRFGADGTLDAAARVALWVTFAASLYELAKTYRRGNPYLVWRLDPSKNNCRDCVRLDGQVHRGKDWRRSGWTPKGSNLACNGFHCGCRFVEATGPAVGGF